MEQLYAQLYALNGATALDGERQHGFATVAELRVSIAPPPPFFPRERFLNIHEGLALLFNRHIFMFDHGPVLDDGAIPFGNYTWRLVSREQYLNMAVVHNTASEEGNFGKWRVYSYQNGHRRQEMRVNLKNHQEKDLKHLHDPNRPDIEKIPQISFLIWEIKGLPRLRRRSEIIAQNFPLGILPENGRIDDVLLEYSRFPLLSRREKKKLIRAHPLCLQGIIRNEEDLVYAAYQRMRHHAANAGAGGDDVDDGDGGVISITIVLILFAQYIEEEHLDEEDEEEDDDDDGGHEDGDDDDDEYFPSDEEDTSSDHDTNDPDYVPSEDSGDNTEGQQPTRNPSRNTTRAAHKGFEEILPRR